MLDKDTIRAANYQLNSVGAEASDELLGIDGEYAERFWAHQLEGALNQVHAEIHEAKAKQLRGEKLSGLEQALANGDSEESMLALLMSSFRFGLALAHYADTQDLTEGRAWVAEHPDLTPHEQFERMTHALGLDVAVIAVGPDGEAEVLHHTGEPPTEEELAEIVKADGDERIGVMGRRRGEPSEAEKHRGM